jgi:alkylhydroperoxidase family enzyme
MQDSRQKPGLAVPLRLTQPRIEPVQDATATPEQAAALARYRSDRWPLLNITRTLAHVPEALDGFMPWANYVLSKRNSLSARHREIVILRVGAKCRAGYEFAQHVRIGKRAGLTDAEIERLHKGGPDDWPEDEAVLIRAADEVVADHFVSDATWAELLARFSQRQAMDVVFTAAEYVMVSTMLNSFGVQIEADL